MQANHADVDETIVTDSSVCISQVAMLQGGEANGMVIASNNSALKQVLRPSKVRAMLAMRACRGSIMIGKALTKDRMTKVVRNLAGLESPWNCPHGRPTMRHLTPLPDTLP